MWLCFWVSTCSDGARLRLRGRHGPTRGQLSLAPVGVERERQHSPGHLPCGEGKGGGNKKSKSSACSDWDIRAGWLVRVGETGWVAGVERPANTGGVAWQVSWFVPSGDTAFLRPACSRSPARRMRMAGCRPRPILHQKQLEAAVRTL